MLVSEIGARHLLESMGLPVAGVPVKKIVSKLNRLRDLVDTSDRVGGEALDLQESILLALENGEEIEVVGDVPAKTQERKEEQMDTTEHKEGKSQGKKAKKGGKPAKKVKKAGKGQNLASKGHSSNGNGQGLDAFGCRPGSMPYKVNEILMKSKKPMSPQDILKKLGMGNKVAGFYAYLNKQTREGHFEKEKTSERDITFAVK